MQFVLTTYGLNSLTNSGTPASLSYKLGSSYNYTPLSTDIDIHGTDILNGATLAVQGVGVNQPSYPIILDDGDAIAPFGEVGLYLAGNLFALGVNTTPITYDGTSNLSILCVLPPVSGEQGLFSPVSAPGQNGINYLPSLDSLPRAGNVLSQEMSNIYGFLNDDIIAVSGGQWWRLVGTNLLLRTQVGTPIAAGIINIAATLPGTPAVGDKYYVSIASGAKAGVVRSGAFIASGSGTSIALNVSLPHPLAAGDWIYIYNAVLTVVSGGGGGGGGIPNEIYQGNASLTITDGGSAGTLLDLNTDGVHTMQAVYVPTGVPTFWYDLSARSTTVANEEGSSVKLDAQGNTVVVGSCYNANVSQGYIAKFSPVGDLIWQTVLENSSGTLSGPLQCYLADLVFDSTGNIWALMSTRDDTGGSDSSLLKISSSGALLSSIPVYPPTGTGSYEPVVLNIDAQDNMYVIGDSNPESTGNVASLLKISNTGSLVWGKSFTWPGYQPTILYPTGTLIDKNGNVVFSINYEDLGGTNVNVVNLQVLSAADGSFIQEVISVNGFGVAGRNQFGGLVIDSTGNLMASVCASTEGLSDNDSVLLCGFDSSYVHQYTLKLVFSDPVGTVVEIAAYGIVKDAQDNTYIAALVTYVSGTPYRSLLIISVAPNRSIRWAKVFQSPTLQVDEDYWYSYANIDVNNTVVAFCGASYDGGSIYNAITGNFLSDGSVNCDTTPFTLRDVTAGVAISTVFSNT